MILLVCVLVALTAVVTVNCSKEKADKSGDAAAPAGDVKLETLRQKNSYALGYQMGMNFKPIVNYIDLGIFFQGVKDAAVYGKGKMKPEEVRKLLMDFQKEMMKRQQEERKVQGEKNKAEGEKFLAENAKKEGVKTTESGLQYKVIKEGNGPSPKLEDRVSVTYRGAMLDDTVFDERKKPITFKLQNMINGWKEGIPLMKIGSKFRFFIPSNLGYGPRGNRNIGPNAVLIFDVELFEINPKPPAPPKPPVKPVVKPNAQPKKPEKKK